VVTGICLGLVDGPFDSLVPGNAPLTLAKMLCRWHSWQRRRDGDIHQRAAGNVLHSRFPSGLMAHSPGASDVSDARGCVEIYRDDRELHWKSRNGPRPLGGLGGKVGAVL
jgi:hypothetical protein